MFQIRRFQAIALAAALGLAATLHAQQQLVELHGSTVHVEDRATRSARFVVTLARAK